MRPEHRALFSCADLSVGVIVSEIFCLPLTEIERIHLKPPVLPAVTSYSVKTRIVQYYKQP